MQSFSRGDGLDGLNGNWELVIRKQGNDALQLVPKPGAVCVSIPEDSSHHVMQEPIDLPSCSPCSCGPCAPSCVVVEVPVFGGFIVGGGAESEFKVL